MLTAKSSNLFGRCQCLMQKTHMDRYMQLSSFQREILQLNKPNFPRMDFLFGIDSDSFPECKTVSEDNPGLPGTLVQKGQELENKEDFEAPAILETTSLLILTLFTKAVAVSLQWWITFAAFFVALSLTSGTQCTRAPSAEWYTVS